MVLSQRSGHRGQRGRRQELEHLVQPAHRRRSITWPPTIASPTGSTARSRIRGGVGVSHLVARGRADLPQLGAHLPRRRKQHRASRSQGRQHSLWQRQPAAAISASISPRRSAASCPPRDPDDPNRKTWTLPQVFSQADEALYYANQFVMRSRDRGKTWEKISPDLARLNPPVPATLDPVTAKDIDQPMTDRFGVVYTHRSFAAQANDRLGRHRRRPDPRHTRRWQDLEQRHAAGDDRLEQGLADRGRPFRRRDRLRLGGPPSHRRQQALHLSHARRRQDLAERGRRHSRRRLCQLRQGRPARPRGCSTPPPSCASTSPSTTATSGSRCRTTCRSPPCATSWCTATISLSPRTAAASGCWTRCAALRQIAAQGSQIVCASAYLFQARRDAYAIRAGGMNGTPLPHEEPQEQNPPSGVVAYYWLKSAAAQPVKLELVDGSGAVRACAASDTPVRARRTPKPSTSRPFGMQPAQPPSAAAGMHRFALGATAGRGGGGGGFGRGDAAPPARDACTASMPAPAADAAPAGRRTRRPRWPWRWRRRSRGDEEPGACRPVPTRSA